MTLNVAECFTLSVQKKPHLNTRWHLWLSRKMMASRKMLLESAFQMVSLFRSFLKSSGRVLRVLCATHNTRVTDPFLSPLSSAHSVFCKEPALDPAHESHQMSEVLYIVVTQE